VTPDFAFLDRLADAADAVTLPLFRSALAVDVKTERAGDVDPVTEADRGAERAMRAAIEAAFPDHGIAGEEYGTVRGDARAVWHLDPVDGTRQFVAGVPLWGTMAGLVVEGRPRLGLVSQPFTGERFMGGPQGARHRDRTGERAMRTRRCASLKDATLFTTSPHLYAPEKAQAYDRLRLSCRLTRTGIDCYAFCLLALGFADIVIETGLQSYDIVPLVPIIEAAGGIVTDWSGRPGVMSGDVIALGDRSMLPATVAALRGR
jgi:histidinol phosphatase-like enzyme (inositol monophosphatase family)